MLFYPLDLENWQIGAQTAITCVVPLQFMVFLPFSSSCFRINILETLISQVPKFYSKTNTAGGKLLFPPAQIFLKIFFSQVPTVEKDHCCALTQI